jgi:hypothetical protein
VEQRRDTARVCTAALKLSIPAVLDALDDKINAAYSGWPDRIVIVGIDGRIAYKGGPGPGGFKPAEAEEWLRKNVK